MLTERKTIISTCLFIEIFSRIILFAFEILKKFRKTFFNIIMISSIIAFRCKVLSFRSTFKIMRSKWHNIYSVYHLDRITIMLIKRDSFNLMLWIVIVTVYIIVFLSYCRCCLHKLLSQWWVYEKKHPGYNLVSLGAMSKILHTAIRLLMTISHNPIIWYFGNIR